MTSDLDLKKNRGEMIERYKSSVSGDPADRSVGVIVSCGPKVDPFAGQSYDFPVYFLYHGRSPVRSPVSLLWQGDRDFGAAA